MFLKLILRLDLRKIKTILLKRMVLFMFVVVAVVCVYYCNVSIIKWPPINKMVVLKYLRSRIIFQ